MDYREAMIAAGNGAWVTREAWYNPESFVRVTVDASGRAFEEQDGFRQQWRPLNNDVLATDWKLTNDPR